MRTLDRYIAKTVILSMLVIMALIGGVDFLFTYIDELGDINANYSAMNALQFVLMTTPTALHELLPFMALGGALVGLGILASSNELVIMQAAGISTYRIAWSVMKPTLLVMLLGLFMGEWLAPTLEQQAQSNRALIQSGGEAINTSHGDWHKIGNEFVHVNAIAPGGRQLFGITRYQLNERRQLISSSFASAARYIQTPDTNYWLLEDVVETRFANAQIMTDQHDTMTWEVDLSPQLLSVLLVEPKYQSISGLYRFAGYFATQNLDSKPYFLAFWKKLLQPLTTAALVLLAISFVFGPLRDATMGYRVFVAICIGLGFNIIERTLAPTTLIYGLDPVLAVLLPIMLSAGLGLALLRRV
ncbi:MAG: LPS export ABC transporter permease LptG [Pseudomonadales bacterium]|nr:LPS export ABC transporter permease LptG [Pseudomonadales bacterium]